MLFQVLSFGEDLGEVSQTAERLLDESGKTMVAMCGCKGKADLPEAERPCATLAANPCGPWVWTDCRTKACVAKEASPIS